MPTCTAVQRRLQKINDRYFIQRSNSHATVLHDLDRRTCLQLDVAAPAHWLTCIPSMPTLTIPDAELRTLLAARFLHTPGVNIPGSTDCPLCHQRPAAQMPSHCYTCKRLSQWTIHRHNRALDILLSFCPANTAKEVGLTDSSHLRMDLIVPDSAAATTASTTHNNNNSSTNSTSTTNNNNGPSALNGNSNSSSNNNNGNNGPTTPNNSRRTNTTPTTPNNNTTTSSTTTPNNTYNSSSTNPTRTTTAIDITIVAARHGDNAPDDVFQRAARKKKSKYQRFEASSSFTTLSTFAISPFGHLSPTANQLLQRFIPNPTQRTLARSLISVSVARATARMIQCWTRRSQTLTHDP